MGGGDNWVGYHLVGLLALHAHSVGQIRPVPRFIILDQPSQVHCEKVVVDDSTALNWTYPQDRAFKRAGEHRDVDDIAVSAMFQFLARTVSELNAKFQIVVMDDDDVDEKVFQESVVGVGEAGRR
jgi:hypothetical protein